VPWFRQLFSLPAARAAVRLARRVDLVHVHQGEDLAVLPIGVTAARSANVPLVVTLHTSLRHTFSGTGLRARILAEAGGRIEAIVCARAAAVIAVSARLAALLREGGLAAGRLHVIPPGVNSSEFAGDGGDPFPDLPHPRVVFVGRLAFQKGVETLVQAASLMRRTDARIVLVGDGPYRRAIEETIRAHRLEDRVRVVGFRSHTQIPRVLRHSDVFCLPSRFEELSTALLEAMRAGLPIVSSNVGALPEALDCAGRLVPPNDPRALSRAIDELLTDTALASRLAAKARDRARAFEWSNLASRVLDLYRAVVARHRTGTCDRSIASW
jgi:glycosyltransferase involved in cell wall biosynthesis